MISSILSGRRPSTFALAAVLLSVAAFCSTRAVAAEPETVGVLALAVEGDVAGQLALSDQQKQDLENLIAARQKDAQQLAPGLEGLSGSERAKRLAAFRHESELQGWAILTPQQRTQLKQIWMRRSGFASLADREIAARLELTPDQARQIEVALSLRAALLDEADGDAAVVIRAVTDKKLAALLTPEQRAAWEALLKESTPDSPPALAADEAPTPPAETTPAETAPPAAEPAPDMPPAPSEQPVAAAETAPQAAEATASTEPVETVAATPAETAAPADEPAESAVAVVATEPAPAEESTPATEPAEQPTEKAITAAEPEAPAEAAKPAAAEPAPAEVPAPTTEPTVPGEPGVAVATDVPKELPAAEPAAMVAPPAAAQQEPAASEVVASDQNSAVTDVKTEPAQPAAVAPSGQPADQAAAGPEEEPVKLRFNFRYQPWQDVLDWFAEQAGLSLVLDTPPPGTFNYVDDREYTPAEAIDILNKVLLVKGFVLVRSGRMLMLFDLEHGGIPESVVTTIPMEDLDNRGEYELVAVLFQLQRISPDEAQQEISELLGPQGSVVILPKSQQLKVTDTAGRLRTIRRVIQAIEDPEGLTTGQLQVFEVKYVTPEEVLAMARPLLDIPADQTATSDGSLRFSVMPFGTRILATGKPEMLTRFKAIIDTIDVPTGTENGPEQAMQLEIYPIHTADPEAVLKVVQTLLAGLPDVRLELEPKTNALIALARPSEHATIRATIDQMESDAPHTEVIQLHVLDPQIAVLSINKMLGTGGTEGPTKGPTIDADPTSRQLIVHGTTGQIAQVRDLLEKLGETEDARQAMTGSGNVRVLPLSSRAARSVLEQLQQVWPTMRPNKIRQVTPSAIVPSMKLRHEDDGEQGSEPQVDEELLYQYLNGGLRSAEPSVPSAPAEPQTETPQTSNPRGAEAAPAEDKSAAWSRPAMPGGARIFLTAAPAAKPATTPPTPKSQPAPKPQPAPEASPGDKAPAAKPEKKPSDEPAEIIVSIGPGGLVIASDDVEALNDFENLVNTLSSGSFSTTPELTIFYLKHAKAAPVAETLDTIFGGGTLTGGSSGGGGLAQDMADAALGDMGGGILGALMGFGGGNSITPTGAIKITPETRLNALIVQANPVDLDSVKQLLEILDQKDSPEEVLAVPKPRLVPVYNTQASVVAQMVQQAYSDRLATAGGSGGRQPSPQEIIEAIRGGGRGGSGRGGRGSSNADEVQKMTIGVDTASNSVIVTAAEPLFQQVKEFIEELDQMATTSNETMQTVQLHDTSPEMVQKALSALVGDSVQFSRSGSTSSSRRPTTGQPSSTPGGQPGMSPQDMQQRMEFFRALRSRMGGGGPPGGGSTGGRTRSRGSSGGGR